MINKIIIILIGLMAIHLLVSVVNLVRGKKDKISSCAHIFAFAYFLIELCRYKLFLDQISPIDSSIYSIFKISYFIIFALEIGMNKADIWNYSFIVSVLLMQTGWSVGYDNITRYGFILCAALFLFISCYYEIKSWRRTHGVDRKQN